MQWTMKSCSRTSCVHDGFHLNNGKFFPCASTHPWPNGTHWAGYKKKKLTNLVAGWKQAFPWNLGRVLCGYIFRQSGTIKLVIIWKSAMESWSCTNFENKNFGGFLFALFAFLKIIFSSPFFFSFLGFFVPSVWRVFFRFWYTFVDKSQVLI